MRPWGRASVDYYFPDPDHPDLQPFIQAFARMMFAHAEFENRFANLVSVIARKKMIRYSANDQKTNGQSRSEQKN